MNPTNKRSFIHQANKERTSESDIPNKFKVMETIKENFGLYPVTDEVIVIPNGFAEYRKPDLLIKNTTPILILELQGPRHNLDGETIPQRMDIRKESDYAKLGKDYKVVEFWGGDKNTYPEEKVIEALKKKGVPVNEIEAKAYRERKKRCHRY